MLLGIKLYGRQAEKYLVFSHLWRITVEVVWSSFLLSRRQKKKKVCTIYLYNLNVIYAINFLSSQKNK